jgi:hypothetical protein
VIGIQKLCIFISIIRKQVERKKKIDGIGEIEEIDEIDGIDGIEGGEGCD